FVCFFFFSSRRRHTRSKRDWSSDVCSSDLVSAFEDEHGLKVDVQLDLDNPNGAYTHKLIQEGRVSQMSFAFDIEDFAFAQSEELGDYMELRKLKIHEVSVVQV